MYFYTLRHRFYFYLNHYNLFYPMARGREPAHVFLYTTGSVLLLSKLFLLGIFLVP